MAGTDRNIGTTRLAPPPSTQPMRPEKMQENTETERTLMELKNTTLDDIAAVIGFSATLRLVAWFGDGGNLYVPLTAEDGSRLVRLLGISAARQLCLNWPGEHLAIPRLRDHEDDLRKRFVARMIEKGFGTREIASMQRMSERRVQQILRELEVAGLVQVAGPARRKVPAEKPEENALQKNWGAG